MNTLKENKSIKNYFTDKKTADIFYKVICNLKVISNAICKYAVNIFCCIPNVVTTSNFHGFYL